MLLQRQYEGAREKTAIHRFNWRSSCVADTSPSAARGGLLGRLSRPSCDHSLSYAAGGGTDILARILSQDSGAIWQTIHSGGLARRRHDDCGQYGGQSGAGRLRAVDGHKYAARH